MKYLALIALLLTGCADVHKVWAALHADPPTFDNRSAYPDGLFFKVWSELEAEAQINISLDGKTAIVYEDLGEFEDACPEVDDLGCGDEDNVHIFGGYGTDFRDVGTETAHRLGHVYLYQTNRGSDGRHAHLEWWGEDGYVARIRHLIEAGSIQ